MENKHHYNDPEVTAVFDKLQGLVCQRVLFAADGTLILFLGDVVRHDPIVTMWRLFISGTWRLDDEHHLLAGSFDEPERVVSTLQPLKGTPVSSVTMESDKGDLLVTFASGLKVFVFPSSWEHEHWQVRHEHGFRMTFGPEARLSFSQEKLRRLRAGQYRAETGSHGSNGSTGTGSGQEES